MVTVPTEDVHSGATNMQLKCRHTVTIVSLHCLYNDITQFPYGLYTVHIQAT